MKAAVYTEYGSPDVLQVKEIEKPVPKDNEVLIKVYAATVTATDCVFRRGKPFISRSYTGFTKPKHAILGDEFAGEIETVGRDVKQFKPGDSVFGTLAGSGAYAEYICRPVKELTLAVKPANMTCEEAAASCDGTLTALPFLKDKGNIQSGQNVLIYGASGSVGSFAVQLAKYFGTEVTGVCSTANLEMVKSLGADKVIDYTQEDFTKTGVRYDIIFDSVGKTSFSRCKNSLTKKGIYLTTVLGMPIIFQMLLSTRFSPKKAAITFTGMKSAAERTKDLIFIKKLIETGKIKTVIDRSYPLEQIAEAHRYVEKGHKKGNVVITVEHNSKT